MFGGPCDAMRADPLFQQMRQFLLAEIAPGKERQALSHHTTKSCRPKELREEAPLVSLASAGFDNVEEIQGGFVVRIRGQNLIQNGDNLAVEYVSPVCVSNKEAQRVAAVEYLCLLLGASPNDIRLAPKCFKQGDLSVEILRAAAQGILAARSGLSTSHLFDAWEWATGRAPLVPPAPGLYPPAPQPRQRDTQYSKDVALREEDVVSELLLWKQPPEGFDACKLLICQREFLAKNICPGTLWKFLGRHPQMFITDQAAKKWWLKKEGVSTTLGLPASSSGAAAPPPPVGATPPPQTQAQPVASVSVATGQAAQQPALQQAAAAAPPPQMPAPAAAGDPWARFGDDRWRRGNRWHRGWGDRRWNTWQSQWQGGPYQ